MNGWPEWMPESVRSGLWGFWVGHGSVESWERYVGESVPGGMAAVGTVRTIHGYGGKPATGRFIPMWNNIARVVLDDGSVEAGSFEQSTGVQTVSQEDWLARARVLFGPDTGGWRFVCPACGNVQSIASVLAAAPELTCDDVKGWIYYNCQGRYTAGGCDWTLGGLIRRHRLEVVKDDGSVMPVFEFDG